MPRRAYEWRECWWCARCGVPFRAIGQLYLLRDVSFCNECAVDHGGDCADVAMWIDYVECATEAARYFPEHPIPRTVRDNR